MNLDEIIINIDFEDRTGLGYEIFEVCEKNGIDKISMEVIPDQGMFIKMRAVEENKSTFLQDLRGIKGVNEISFRNHMPYESREHKLNTILNAISEGVVAVSENGEIKHINKLACKILECASDEALPPSFNLLGRLPIGSSFKSVLPDFLLLKIQICFINYLFETMQN
ncbi:hypothetical protein V7150_10405 [Neobacillus drentensis]|uniref:hypothetical protein n=1 Tax=Neobacillus drentensis TaxID=220684 RepID=UPI0030004940